MSMTLEVEVAILELIGKYSIEPPNMPFGRLSISESIYRKTGLRVTSSEIEQYLRSLYDYEQLFENEIASQDPVDFVLPDEIRKSHEYAKGGAILKSPKPPLKKLEEPKSPGSTPKSSTRSLEQEEAEEKRKLRTRQSSVDGVEILSSPASKAKKLKA
eukprot:TRINITY_DN7311_c0_g1_i1.p1 TRINITY_DN7311_c0_g1~~TRINITY_DN7311_c0_g1_i1.p1  ORF type:complete len:158 (-),score=46.63 TRINITY_DN7311_c0_g1_i1:126-599(-)